MIRLPANSAQVDHEAELAIHLRMALRQGWTEEELTEVLLHLLGYVGAPDDTNKEEAKKFTFYQPDVEGKSNVEKSMDEYLKSFGSILGRKAITSLDPLQLLVLGGSLGAQALIRDLITGIFLLFEGLVAAVIGSAVIPTLIANAFFMPTHLRPHEVSSGGGERPRLERARGKGKRG